MATTSADVPEAAVCAERSLIRYLMILFQLGLFLVVLNQYKLESRAFLHIGILSFFGWSVHYFLPQQYRLGLFVSLSLFGIVLVFGFQEETWSSSGLMQAAWIIGLGLSLLATCHLPVSFAWRVGILVVFGCALAAGRAGAVAVPWSIAVWPVLASMFMFRLILYLHQLRHENKPVGVLEALAYFFMLPNVCFLLFPVVDFQTFRRTYYDQDDRHQIYQTGIHWLFRGTIHLILYRYVYQNFVIEAAEVTNRVDLVQFLLWPFLLYLKISGTFHLITGLMHLFGFNLPETHKLYFMSASFTDFWRRINIYWKDFIMKVFYYPCYFRVQKWGNTTAIVTATIFAFFMTWILHAYQWFWIRGTWLLEWNDGVFWLILCLLVLGNAIYEVKFGRRRRLPGKALSWRQTLPISLRTVGVLVTIMVLWSFWSANSVEEWLSVWAALGNGEAFDGFALYLLAFVLAVGVPAALVARGHMDRPFHFTRSAAMTSVLAVTLIVVSIPKLNTFLDETVQETVTRLKKSELNSRDYAKLQQGYYENLTNVGMFNTELQDIYRTRPSHWLPIKEQAQTRKTGGLPFFEILPSVEFPFKGGTVRTNRWGMRDREYARTPPKNTLRIAVLGSSHVFGSGVDNEETFEALLEERLNREAPGGMYDHYELLNFARGGFIALDSLAILENKVINFKPDYVFYFEHSDNWNPLLKLIARIITRQVEHPYDFLRNIVRKAGINESQSPGSSNLSLLVKKLRPYKEELLSSIYKRIVKNSRERGWLPVWIFLPRLDKKESIPKVESHLARMAGFTLLDLSGAYDRHEVKSLWIARWDHHPNFIAHQLIAKKLYKVLRDAKDTVPLGLPGS